MRSLYWSCLLSGFLLLGCGGGFGHGIRWRDATTFESNLGTNRYLYRLTSTGSYTPTLHAVPVASIVPSGAVEVGIISVSVEYSGWGSGGLRRTPGEFFDDLATAAQRLGGTHFHIQSTEVAHGYVSGMTVSALRVPEEQPAESEPVHDESSVQSASAPD